MKKKSFIIVFLSILILTSCSPKPAPEPVPTITQQPTMTVTIALIITNTPVPTETEIPITFVSLASPYAENCGDGIPRIWSNDSFNGPFTADGFDDHHGHVDIDPPENCIIDGMKDGFVAPASGTIKKYILSGDGTDPHTYGYKLLFPEKTYPEGILSALEFAGIEYPDVNKITEMALDFGHVYIPNEGYIEKGQKIGEVLRFDSNQIKIGYQVVLLYDDLGYMFSPTLFTQDIPNWKCTSNSPYDCEPEQFDYAK